MVIVGLATIAGRPAPAGTPVRAYVGTILCGSATTWSSDTINFTLQVASSAHQGGCGTPGATVTFTVNDTPATPTMPFAGGTTQQITLTAP